MKTAIVTGASSGIGLELTKVLLDQDIQVFGFGRDFTNTKLVHPLYHTFAMDLTNQSKFLDIIHRIQKEHPIHYLINNAGVGYFGPHEELNPKKIHEMVYINIEVPMMLTQLLLRNLKKNQGHIINISSVTANKNNTYGCAYGATKAALTSFSKSLFDEARKYGVKVTVIHPDMTKSNFYRNANFTEGTDDHTYLNPSEIADALEWILSCRDGINVSELTIQPQKHCIQRK